MGTTERDVRDVRDTEELLARSFEANRPRLLRVAYTMTGSLVEAEDCVQEAWLRLRGLDDPAAVRDLAAWLTTTVSRLALDALSSARARRERYVGTWLPEPARAAGSLDILPSTVNGAPGLVIRGRDGGLSVMAFTVDAGLITAIDLMRNPDKLARVPDLG